MLGGTATAIAMLRENYPEVYEQYKDDPNALAYAAAQLAESATTPELTGLEELEAPRDYDLLQSLFTDKLKINRKNLIPNVRLKHRLLHSRFYETEQMTKGYLPKVLLLNT
jgi:hypothetical protein